MYVLLHKHAPSRKIFYISVFVFVVINLIENLIHYTIGRERQINISIPTRDDMIRIVIIMMIFALLQGTLTCYFIGC